MLTSGGHNAGIVSPPGHPHRHFRIATRKPSDRYMDPDAWVAGNDPREGSWWPAWTAWLEARSGARVAPPRMGAPANGYAPICDAPGTYVRMT